MILAENKKNREKGWTPQVGIQPFCICISLDGTSRLLLVVVDVRTNLPPKSVGFGDGYMPQRLVCFVVRVVKNNDQM